MSVSRYWTGICRTKERADLAEVYDVSRGNETAILYNYERPGADRNLMKMDRRICRSSWVNDHINERFYWDSTEDLLVYALPDQIVYADAETKGANGAPLLLVKMMSLSDAGFDRKLYGCADPDL